MTQSASAPRTDEIKSAARALVATAFVRLEEERVIPTSRYHPWIRVGRDFEGSSVMGLPEFTQLEGLLQSVYQDRFADPLQRRNAEFAHTYILHMIEAAVRRCADTGGFDADSEAVAQSIQELIDVLGAPHQTVAVVRAVSHMATTDGQRLVIGDVEVVPERSHDDFDFLLEECRQRIPGTGSAFNRERPLVFAHPHAILATRAQTRQTADVFETLDRGGRTLDRFMLLVRLLTGTTSRTQFEVRGPVTLVGSVHPHITHPESTTTVLMPFIRRTAVLDAAHRAPIQALAAILDSVAIRRQDMWAATLDVALERFTGSFQTDGLGAIVDLATALEAVLIDDADGTEGITARLRNRAAALLATPHDPARCVHEDIGAFYSLRSTLVHGGNLSEKKLRGKILGISTVTAKHAFGIAAGEAVDRLRDLVRRAILARLLLASGSQPPWPFDAPQAMDVTFADDECRKDLRSNWRDALAAYGAGIAVDALGPPGQVMVEDYGGGV